MGKPVKKTSQPTDLDMVDDVYGAMMTDTPLKYRAVVWVALLLIVSFIVWAAFAELDRVTRGNGKVIPPSHVQLIQSLDGGILQAMYVDEGQLVEKGMPLARIDDTRFRSDLAQQEQEVDSLRASVTRMYHELDSVTLQPASKPWQQQIDVTMRSMTFPNELTSRKPNLVARQKSEYRSRLESLSNQLEIQARQIVQKRQALEEVASKIKTLTNSMSIMQREINITRPLVEKKIVSEVELLKLERQINDMDGELTNLKLSRPKIKASLDEAILKRREAALQFISETRAKLSETEARLSRLTEAKVGAQDKVNKAVITSPVNGTVKTIHINTLGGVVDPGEDVIEIVPTEDQLLVEVKILPKDIAFLHPGLPAVVKVTAYDFTRYGGLDGTVEHISADTTQDEEGNSFYLVRIRTESSHLTREDGTPMPIIPGMLTSVDIITGKRTVLEYILNPILRAKENALRER
ncbi:MULTISPECIES: HlyD family type I secretion periplasmic adaptor subunit [Salinivibrio]|uniref:Membrane fusion protein (MFP) family protein n=1 Tax=Salinivibrio kushneri TaxID=1908198 RepID=A0AB36JUY9_9GAMM|nr:MULTISPECIES: HlyD family type I secretion periplasmic adaptor subunit [Salinivibrio]ODP96475.1 hemolysin secretion protein D [Salinivibrio sp. BNH]OOE38498.1 hemolysin secretion protein D [Salinivibrio kushneri]OOE51484.1 hemolysin secretion protein D [Salinivibrio kushneri]OOE52076.1 hemolysin secretion protein D [Salinivibrio kushneri]OOE52373.1 hemolysin secretion protein D [Salinivibrio kushneri]